jgi:hypothetical protein
MKAMVNRIKYTHVADIVDYFKNVHKMLGPIECTSMVTRIAMNLGCPEWPTWPTLRGMYLFLVLTICSHTHLVRGTRSFFIYVVWWLHDLVT